MEGLLSLWDWMLLINVYHLSAVPFLLASKLVLSR